MRTMNPPAAEILPASPAVAASAGGGFLLLDKPRGMTSFRAVDLARRALRVGKGGHAGTLDPAATGLLVAGFGFCSRLLELCVGLDKTYEAEVRFGVATDTLDLDGTVLEERDADPGEAAACAALARSLGAVEQEPPVFSSLKQAGRPLHRLARAGVAVDTAARRRTVTFHELAPLGYDPGPRAGFRFRVRCSSGTYIRSLARDLGRALGVPAVLAALVRTAVGPWPLPGAVAPEAATSGHLIPPDRFLAPLGVVAVELVAEQAARVRHGNPVATSHPPAEAALCRDGDGRLLCLARIDPGGALVPRKGVGQAG